MPVSQSGISGDLTSSTGLHISFSCLNAIDVPVAECEALVRLYNATDGDLWIHKNNRLTSTTVDSRYGITVEDGHVTRIDEDWNNLS